MSPVEPKSEAAVSEAAVAAAPAPEPRVASVSAAEATPPRSPESPESPPVAKRRRKAAKLTVRRGVPGAPPGVLRIDRKAPKPVISLLAYGPDGVEEVQGASLEVVKSKLGQKATLWIRVIGLGDARLLEGLRDLLALHPLAMEDVVTVVQRPKAEQYGEHWFFVMRQIRSGEQLETQQISIFWGANFVVSFEEWPDSALEPLRRRIREGLGHARSTGADYLAYSIIDAVVDNLFPVLEGYGERLESLEESILSAPAPDALARIQEVKHDLLVLRRSIWPLRDALATLYRDEGHLIRPETRVYMRDCYDHAVQLIDIIESYREFATGLADLLLSTISHRMNEIMKVLTIIATIFIPLSFIASVYGMNFDTHISPLNMPELEWYLGYPFALLLMAGTAGALLYYFRSKGWIGKPVARKPNGEGMHRGEH